MQVRYKCYITRGSRPTVNQSLTITVPVSRHHVLIQTILFQIRMKRHYSGGSRPSRKQCRQFIQALQDEAGIGPGSPGPVCGRHRPYMSAMYLAARGALGAVDKSAISCDGNTTCPIPRVIISQDILCSDVTNCKRI